MSYFADTKIKSTERDPVMQWVVFGLNNRDYGVSVMQVQEVLGETDVSEIPGAPDYVAGIIDLRGHVVAVVDIKSRFGLPTNEPSETRRIMIVECKKVIVGIMVDSVSEVIALRQSEMSNRPDIGDEEVARYIKGVCNKNDNLLILLDLNELLSDRDMTVIGQL